MQITEKLLLNLSLLLVLMFFFQIIQERNGNSRTRKISFSLYFIVSIFVCMIFSVEAEDGIRFDLRHVPFILGGLYTGKVFLYAGLAIVMRGFLGIDEGFWMAAIFFGSLGLLLKWVHQWFLRLSASQRIGVAVLVTLMSSLLLIEIIFMFHTPILRTEAWIGFILIPSIAVGVISYFLEMIRHNILIRNQLAKAEKMDAVSQMSAAISHEIRNPLTSVKGFLQLLQENSYPEEKKKEFIKIAMDEIDRAEVVINDYLTFSKAALEKEEEIEVGNELEQVLKTFEHKAIQSGINIQTTFVPGLSIRGDKVKFKQGLINLLKNAIEAMPGGGTLTIRTYRSDLEIHILINDTGIGMTEEQLSRLGEPYYSTKGKHGTGLGMMVTFSIIRAMRGKVDVNSRPGKGTSFRIIFPSY
ncbi:sensor histidine kinase [Mesobacillus zeae]|uniref:histidine kinase n=1 Tax=Mesobacillus zeae TaxID=1917180 RepID=A0A398AUY6_9BACI|nr:sensor histidine kinase [Mesobacillus zeae]RID81461.1 sensor histidine kinase [Mesobacillus zeae]